jgi:hypothetical protein
MLCQGKSRSILLWVFALSFPLTGLEPNGKNVAKNEKYRSLSDGTGDDSA